MEIYTYITRLRMKCIKDFALVIGAYNGHEPVVATLLANKANFNTAKNVSYSFSRIDFSLVGK
jgi:hypothetical protein